METQDTALPGVFLLKPKTSPDSRGLFAETYRAAVFEERGLTHGWVQENHSRSMTVGTVRGLHFQAPPVAQAKLLRVVTGAILDVVVDLRRGSKSYGQHLAIELSEDNWTQIYVPIGMAHGFCTLTARTDVLYKVSAYYTPACERGLRWDDPTLGIRWPVAPAAAHMTDRDRAWPGLIDLVSPF